MPAPEQQGAEVTPASEQKGKTMSLALVRQFLNFEIGKNMYVFSKIIKFHDVKFICFELSSTNTQSDTHTDSHKYIIVVFVLNNNKNQKLLTQMYPSLHKTKPRNS